MLRRNLILLGLAIPATAVSAALLTRVDVRGVMPSRPEARVERMASASGVPALSAVAPKRMALAVQPEAAIDASAAAVPLSASVARVTRLNTANDIAPVQWALAGPHDVASRSGAVSSTADAAFVAALDSVRRAAMPQHRARVSGGKASALHASTVPASHASSAHRAAGAMMAGDCWCPEFEALPLSIVFGDAVPGQPVALAVSMTSPEAQPETFAWHVAIYAIGDDGEALGEVRPAVDGFLTVDGDSTGMQDLPPLAPSETMPWLSATQTFNLVCTAVGQTSGVEYASDNYLYIPVPGITVTLTPDTDVQAGDWVRVTIESDGPLGIALSNVRLRLNGGVQLLQPGQTIVDDTASDVIVLLGDLAAGSSFSREQWFVAVDPEWALMSVQLEADEILPQFNCAGLWSDTWWDEPPPPDGDGSDGDPGEGSAVEAVLIDVP